MLIDDCSVNLPTPDLCKTSGDDRVPDETTICLRALNVRPLSSLGSNGFCGLKRKKIKKKNIRRRLHAFFTSGNLHCLDGHSPAILDDDLVHLGVARKVEVGVLGPRGVNVRVRTVTTSARLQSLVKTTSWLTARTTHISVDPLEPVLGAVAGGQVLKVIDGRDALRLCSPEEVLLYRICAEGCQYELIQPGSHFGRTSCRRTP